MFASYFFINAHASDAHEGKRRARKVERESRTGERNESKTRERNNQRQQQ